MQFTTPATTVTVTATPPAIIIHITFLVEKFYVIDILRKRLVQVRNLLNLVPQTPILVLDRRNTRFLPPLFIEGFLHRGVVPLWESLDWLPAITVITHEVAHVSIDALVEHGAYRYIRMFSDLCIRDVGATTHQVVA